MQASDTGVLPPGLGSGDSALAEMSVEDLQDTPSIDTAQAVMLPGRFRPLSEAQIAWFIARGVAWTELTRPTDIRTARGHRASDGYFDMDPDGPLWFAFSQPSDVVFWHPGKGEYATWENRAWALGEDMLLNPFSFTYSQRLNIFRDPAQWLAHGRDGIVIVRWRHLFDRLRDAPNIFVAEEIKPKLRLHMQPDRLPRISILKEGME